MDDNKFYIHDKYQFNKKMIIINKIDLFNLKIERSYKHFEDDKNLWYSNCLEQLRYFDIKSLHLLIQKGMKNYRMKNGQS